MYQLRSVVTSMLAGYMTSVTEIFGKCLEIYLNIGSCTNVSEMNVHC